MTNAVMQGRIAKLEEQRARINNEIQKVRAREAEGVRKQETRKKILLGALMLQKIEKGEINEAKLKNDLDGFLVRDSDRELFELPAKPKAE
jgi:hypothetical protein